MGLNTKHPTEMGDEEINEYIHQWVDEFIDSQIDLNPDENKLISDNLFDLCE